MTAAVAPAPAPSPVRRFVGVAGRADTYRNLSYLLLGLPLGTLWFSVLVTAIAVSSSMLVVALVGVPLLIGTWLAVRAFADVERAVANALLGLRLPLAGPGELGRRNPWVRLRTMSADRLRWRELGYLVLRFPAGIATFTVAVTALATPLLVAYAPILARIDHDDPFGHWAGSSTLEDLAAGSAWSWLLVPVGLFLLPVSLHLLGALAAACGRWTAASLDGGH